VAAREHDGLIARIDHVAAEDRKSCMMWPVRSSRICSWRSRWLCQRRVSLTSA